MILASAVCAKDNIPTPAALAARAYMLSWRCSDSESVEGCLDVRFIVTPRAGVTLSVALLLRSTAKKPTSD